MLPEFSKVEEVKFHRKRQVGFWTSGSIPEKQVGSDSMGHFIASSSLEKPPSSGATLQNGNGEEHSVVNIDKRDISSVGEGITSMFKASQTSRDHMSKSWKLPSIHHFPHNLGKTSAAINGNQWESSLFSSSFSDIFNRNVRLSANGVISQHSMKVAAGMCEEEEPFEASEDIEAKTIGNLLPTEDDLFSGVTCDFGSNGRATGGDDLEDFDLFSSGGGMELEGDDSVVRVLRQGGLSFGQRDSNGCVVNGNAYGKHSPSYEVRMNDVAASTINENLIKQDQNYVTAAKCLLEQSELKQIDSLSMDPFGVLPSRQIAFSSAINSSSCMENGAVHGLHPAIQPPMSSFIDHHRIAGVTQKISSPFSGGRQVGLVESVANQGGSNLHPHSLPEYHDNLANGFHFNSPTAIGGMTNLMASKMRGGITNSSVRGVGPNGRLMDISKVSGSPGNGGSSPGHHLLWNNKSSSDWQHVSNQMIWPNSPSFVRNVNPHHASHVTGFSRPPVLLSTTPVHHVGSAPTVDPSMWDRRNAYAGDLSETSNLHLGSLGNTGFPLRSPPHQLDATSPNIFPRVGGGLLDMTKHAGVGSPHRISNNFPGRNLMMSVPASFDSSSDRCRSFSQRRVDSNPNPCDRKQYELDIERIMRGDDTRTTLMIKNIPNKYTSKMLLAAIDEHCRGTYDFIYLPIDFKNKCNVGYAFINMIDAQQIVPFHSAFNGKKWEKFNSEKVTNLAYARIQGKAALVAHFQNSSLMNEDKRCRPILFRTDGPNAGDPEPFPVGPNVRLKVAKSRSNGNEENHQLGNLPTIVTVEDSGNGTDSSNSD